VGPDGRYGNLWQFAIEWRAKSNNLWPKDGNPFRNCKIDANFSAFFLEILLQLFNFAANTKS
jgi:hypothetical protein